MKKLLAVLAVVALTLCLVCDISYARGGGGGGRSFGGGGSKSWGGGGSKSSGWGGSKSSTPSKSTPAPSSGKASGITHSRDSKNTSSVSNQSKADAAAYKAAASSGKTFKTKADAVSSFNKTAETKYPSKFEKEPATRPSHIPNSYTTPDGRNTTINYNSQYGGYGYMDPITNMFIMYSMASMMSDHDKEVIMVKDGYYVNGDPKLKGNTAVVPVEEGCSAGVVILIAAVVVFVIGIFIILGVKGGCFDFD